MIPISVFHWLFSRPKIGFTESQQLLLTKLKHSPKLPLTNRSKTQTVTFSSNTSTDKAASASKVTAESTASVPDHQSMTMQPDAHLNQTKNGLVESAHVKLDSSLSTINASRSLQVSAQWTVMITVWEFAFVIKAFTRTQQLSNALKALNAHPPVPDLPMEHAFAMLVLPYSTALAQNVYWARFGTQPHQSVWSFAVLTQNTTKHLNNVNASLALVFIIKFATNAQIIISSKAIIVFNAH